MSAGPNYLVYFGGPESDSWVDVNDSTSLVSLERGSNSLKGLVCNESAHLVQVRDRVAATYHRGADLRYQSSASERSAGILEPSLSEQKVVMLLELLRPYEPFDPYNKTWEEMRDLTGNSETSKRKHSLPSPLNRCLLDASAELAAA